MHMHALTPQCAKFFPWHVQEEQTVIMLETALDITSMELKSGTTMELKRTLGIRYGAS